MLNLQFYGIPVLRSVSCAAEVRKNAILKHDTIWLIILWPHNIRWTCLDLIGNNGFVVKLKWLTSTILHWYENQLQNMRILHYSSGGSVLRKLCYDAIFCWFEGLEYVTAHVLEWVCHRDFRKKNKDIFCVTWLEAMTRPPWNNRLMEAIN